MPEEPIAPSIRDHYRVTPSTGSDPAFSLLRPDFGKKKSKISVTKKERLAPGRRLPLLPRARIDLDQLGRGVLQDDA
jgi:hypothetical protein